MADIKARNAMLTAHKAALKSLEDRHAARAKSVSYNLATRVVKAKATAQDEGTFQQSAFKEMSTAATKHAVVLKSAHRAGATTGRHHAKQEIESYGLKSPVIPIANTSAYTAAARDALSNSNDAALGKVYDAATPEDARTNIKELVRRASVAASVVANRAYTDQQLAMFKATALANPDKTFLKVWATNPNSEPCPECIRLDGTAVGLWDEFPHAIDSPVFQNDLSGPPRHPNCRCRLVLKVINKASGLASAGSDTPTVLTADAIDEGLEEFIVLHGHKGKPGYFLLHDPNKTKAQAADKIYKIYGQHAVTPQAVANVIQGKSPAGAVPAGTMPSRLTNPTSGEPVKLKEGEHATGPSHYTPGSSFAVHHKNGSISAHSSWTSEVKTYQPGTQEHASFTKEWKNKIAEYVPEPKESDNPNAIVKPDGSGTYLLKPDDEKYLNADGTYTVLHGNGSVTQFGKDDTALYPAGTPTADALINVVKSPHSASQKDVTPLDKVVELPKGKGEYVLKPGEKELKGPGQSKIVSHPDGSFTYYKSATGEPIEYTSDSPSAQHIADNPGIFSVLQEADDTPSTPSTTTPSAAVEGLPTTIPKQGGGDITVTPQHLAEAITTLKNQAGIYVKQPLAKIKSPLAEMDYHAVAALHPAVKSDPKNANKGTKAAVIHHLEKQLAFATAPPAPTTTEFGGIPNMTVGQLKSAHKALSEAKGIMVKQPLSAKGHPLAEMDYHGVAGAHAEATGNKLVGKDKTKQNVLGALQKKIDEMEAGTPSVNAAPPIPEVATPKLKHPGVEIGKFYTFGGGSMAFKAKANGKFDTFDANTGAEANKDVDFEALPDTWKETPDPTKKTAPKPAAVDKSIPIGAQWKAQHQSQIWTKIGDGEWSIDHEDGLPPEIVHGWSDEEMHNDGALKPLAETKVGAIDKNGLPLKKGDQVLYGKNTQPYEVTNVHSDGTFLMEHVDEDDKHLSIVTVKPAHAKMHVVKVEGTEAKPPADSGPSVKDMESNDIHVGDWINGSGGATATKWKVTSIEGSTVNLEHENGINVYAASKADFKDAFKKTTPPEPKPTDPTGEVWEDAISKWQYAKLNNGNWNIHYPVAEGNKLSQGNETIDPNSIGINNGFVKVSDANGPVIKKADESPKPPLLYYANKENGMKYFPDGHGTYDVYDPQDGEHLTTGHKKTSGFPEDKFTAVYDAPVETPAHAIVSDAAKVHGDTSYSFEPTATFGEWDSYHKNADGTWTVVNSNGVVTDPSFNMSPSDVAYLEKTPDYKKVEKGQIGDAPEVVKPKKKVKGAKPGALTPSDMVEKWPITPPIGLYDAKSIGAKYKEYTGALGLEKIAVTPGFLDKGEKSVWLGHIYNGDFASAYKLEKKAYQWKKSPKGNWGNTELDESIEHPHADIHPGSDTNPLNGGQFPPKIATPAAVDGEIPAGSPVPGSWPDSPYYWDADQIDQYLLSAGMKNAHGMSVHSKKNWVQHHIIGNKQNVDQLSLSAQTNVLGGHYLSEEITPEKPVIPVGESVKVPPHFPAFNPGLNHAKNLDQQQTHEYLSNILSKSGFKKAKQQDLAVQQGIVQQHWLAANLAAGDERDKAKVNANAVLTELENSATGGYEPNLPVFGVKHTFSLAPHQPNLPGASQKHIVVDDEGKEWLFKYDKEGGWRAEVENTAHNAGNFFGFGTAPAQTGKFNGKAGLFQAMIKNDGDVAHTAPHQLTLTQQKDVAAEHLLDWALDNDDAHNQNFLLLPNGHTLGIDKGRAWKHLGNPDKAHTLDYPGNMSYNAHLYYTDLYNDIASGKISQEDTDTIYRNVMSRAKSMSRKSDDAYRTILEEGLTNRPGYNKALVDSIIERKNALPDDFDNLWTKVYAQAGYTKPDLEAGKVENSYTGTSPELLDAVKVNQGHGKSTFFSGSDLEDGHLILWETHPQNGETQLQAMGMLREDADKALMKWIKEHGGEHLSVASSDYGTPTPTQSGSEKLAAQWNQTVLAAAKTVSHHQLDKQYNESKLSDLEQLKQQLNVPENLLPADISHAEHQQFADMVSFYKSQIDKIENLKAEGGKSAPGDYVPFDWVPVENPLGAEPEAPKLQVDAKITLEGGAMPSSPVPDSDGKLVTSGTFSSGQPGQEYVIDLGDGVKIRYTSYAQGQKAHQGRMRIEVDKYGDKSDGLDHALDTLRQAGVSLDSADDTDLELLYWRHLHGIIGNRKDGKPGNKYAPLVAAGEKIYAAKLDRNSETDEWRKAFGQQFGEKKVDDWVTSAGYLPKYGHTNIDNPEEETGHPFWHRFDITKADLVDKNFSGHSLSNGDTSALQVITSGGLLSTEERSRRLGGWYPGSSSSSDQGHGSSNFLFSRQNLNGHVSIRISTDALLRTSNYSFSGDNYGEVDNRANSSYFGLTGLTSFSDSGNELMSKQSLSLLDDIEVITFSSATTRQQAIELLKEKGITEIRDVPVTARFVLFDGYANAVDMLMEKKKEGVMHGG